MKNHLSYEEVVENATFIAQNRFTGMNLAYCKPTRQYGISFQIGMKIFCVYDDPVNPDIRNWYTHQGVRLNPAWHLAIETDLIAHRRAISGIDTGGQTHNTPVNGWQFVKEAQHHG